MTLAAELEPVDDPDRRHLQRRTVGSLMIGVLPSGAAIAAAYSSTALLGKEITGSASLGSLAAAFLTIGGTIATVPLAGYMARRGRRPGLRLSWTIAAAGALCAFGAAVLDFYPLLIVGITAVGAGNAANLSARYAASDLAPEHAKAKAIGILVWSGSFGSALGPTLGLGVVGGLAASIGLPKLAGPYLMGIVLFGLAAIAIDRLLRPDPLAVAGGIVERRPGDKTGVSAMFAHYGTAFGQLGKIFGNPSSRLAVVAMLVGHGVMVAVMTATPLHMESGDHELRIIGLVISVHIVGMYFFAPLVGFLVDRFGPRPMIALGGVILLIGAELASHTRAVDSTGVFVGLFLVGVGWSLGLVAGSSLLTTPFSVAERVPVQGAADLVMNTSGAIAGLSAGVIYEYRGYHDLSHGGGLVAAALSGYAVWRMLRSRDPELPRPSAA